MPPMTQNAAQAMPVSTSTQPPVAKQDQIALGFLIACVALGAPLIFADRLPHAIVIALFVTLALTFGVRAWMMRSLLPCTAVDWLMLLAIVLLPIGLWASVDLSMSWPAIAKVVAGFAFFYGLAGLAGTRWMRFVPWMVLVLAAGLAMLVLLTTRWTPAKIPVLPEFVYGLLPALRLPLDVNGIHPNLAGHMMALLLLPAIALALWAPGRRVRWTAGAISVLLGLVLLLSQSRGAWIAAAGALAIMPWLRYRRWWTVVLALAVIAAILAVWQGPVVLERLLFPIAAGDEVSVNTLPGRLEIWSRAILLLRDFGLTGGGAGNFEQVVMTLYPPFFTSIMGGFGHAHNVYLQMAVDFGLPGLIVFVAFLIGMAASLVVSTRLGKALPAEGSAASLAIGLFGSLLVVVIHGLVDAPLATPRVYVVVFVLFGMAAAASSHLIRAAESAHLAQSSSLC
jgi:putative inorganic carbon (HCO3(-)) transporter